MNQLVEIIKKEKIVAILRGVPGEKMEQVITALYNGGIRVLEITFNQKSETRHEETGGAIRLAKKLFPDMCVGAGTTMSVEDVQAAYDAGAQFILAPDVNEAVIKKAVELGMLAVPGAMTPTEIATAHRHGAEIVKLFPAGNFGTAYVKAITAPISHIPLMAVGGIDLNNMKDFLNAGICSVGMGSCLTDKKMIENNDWTALTELTKKYVEAAK